MFSVLPFCNFDNLRDLKQFFDASIGPKGSCKMFVTSAGQVRVTNTSQRLVQSLHSELKDSCAEAILHLIKSHLSRNYDFGLSLGSLTCDLMLNSCLELDIQHLQDVAEHYKLHLDISNISVVLSLLQSTSRCSANNLTYKSHCLKILEAFLTSIPDELDEGKSFNLQLKVEPGNNQEEEANIEKGFLYSLPEIQTWKELNWKPKKQPIKVLLANLQLHQSRNELSDKPTNVCYEFKTTEMQHMTEAMQELLSFCKENQVEIVANQKVFDEEFTSIFKNHGILVLPRIGTQAMAHLKGMTQCKTFLTSIGQLKSTFDFLTFVDSIELIQRKNQNYLKLQKTNSNFVTLLFHSDNEESSDELETTYQRSLALLFDIVRKPYVLPGAGCFESILWHNSKDSSLKICLQHLMSAIHHCPFEEFYTDQIYGHLWLTSEQCCCGIISQNQPKFNLKHFQSSTSNKPQRCQLLKPVSSTLVLDHYESKVAAFCSAIEASQTFLSIGKVINI